MTNFHIAIYSEKTYSELGLSQLSIVKWAITKCLCRFANLKSAFSTFVLNNIHYGPSPNVFPNITEIQLQNNHGSFLKITITLIPRQFDTNSADIVEIGTDSEDRMTLFYEDIKLTDEEMVIH